MSTRRAGIQHGSASESSCCWAGFYFFLCSTSKYISDTWQGLCMDMSNLVQYHDIRAGMLKRTHSANGSEEQDEHGDTVPREVTISTYLYRSFKRLASRAWKPVPGLAPFESIICSGCFVLGGTCYHRPWKDRRKFFAKSWAFESMNDPGTS